MANPNRADWLNDMDIWVITGPANAGKIELGYLITDIALGKGLDTLLAFNVREFSQVESLLKMRQIPPSMLVLVAEEWPIKDMLPQAERLFVLKEGDQDKVARIHQWAIDKGLMPAAEADHA
ncbi:hypothetical protein [Paludibacterium denitrificans]|uniref:Uncharacterized protein n=1 Tax=Paludibacterium denitrificans TaxID=2675226 RepID=A0A844GB25_9NEIS|nr:hypothetical protein [Paludibacterium denitrificans]MTD32438.1 hypothetical protein [Paludibacterium denitrificans]